MHKDDIEKLISTFQKRQHIGKKLLRFRTVVLSDKRIGSSRATFLSSEDSDDEEMNLLLLSKIKPRPTLISKKVKDGKMKMQKAMSSHSDSE